MIFRFLNWLAAGEPWHFVLSIVLHFLGIFTGLWIWYIFPKEPISQMSRRKVTPKELEKGQSLLGNGDEDELLEEEEVISSGTEVEEGAERREGKADEQKPFERSQG